MIKMQCRAFPKCQEFDFRSIFVEDASGKYFDPELLHVLSTITTSDRASRGPSSSTGQIYSHGKKLKLLMVVSILIDECHGSYRNTYLQTLLGLACYAQGLRDKGVKILNAFGVVCSIFHVRNHGSRWARLRSALAELNPIRFWRVTFDT